MSSITAIIPAKNEERNIERCLKSLDWCDHVIVMLMGNDKTGTLAQKMGAEVIEKNKSDNDDFIALQKNINWAIEHTKSEWILRIDADEEVTSDLKKEILATINNSTDIIAYGLHRNQYFWGGFLKGGDWAYDRLVRLFKKGYAEYDPIVNVHEQFKVKGPIGYLKFSLNHYSHPTLQDARKKFDSYTSVQINDMNDSRFRAYFNLIFQPPYVFLRWMIWHHGYRDGIRGLVAAWYRANYDILLYRKYIANKFGKK